MRFARLVIAIVRCVLHLPRLSFRLITDRTRLRMHGTILLWLLFSLALAWQFLSGLYKDVVVAGFFIKRPEAVFFVAIVTSWIMIFFASLPVAHTLFGHQKELELVSLFPLKPASVTAARLCALFLITLPLHLFFFLPALIAYLRFSYSGALLITGLIANLLFVPLFPLALAMLLVLLLRRLPYFFRWGTIIEIASILAAFILLASFQLVLQHALISLDKGNESIFLVRLAEFLDGFMQALPPASWAASAFRSGEGPGFFVLFVLFSLGVLVPVFFIMRRFSPLLTEPLFAGRGKIRTRRAYAPRPGVQLAVLVFREWKLFSARSSVIFEAALRLVILPALLLFYAVAGPKEYLDIIVSLVSSSPLAAIALIALLFFLIDISFLAATGLVREGKLFAVSLMLPASGSLQIKAKLIFLLLLSLPSVGLALILIYFIFSLPLATLVYTIPGIIAYLVFSFTVGIFLDMRRPFISRLSPGRVVRQNANTVAAAMVQAGSLTALGGIAWGLALLGMEPFALTLLVIELVVAANLVIFPLVLRYADRLYCFRLEG